MNTCFPPLRLSRWLPALLFVAALLPATRAETTTDRTMKDAVSATVRSVQVDHRLGPVTITGVDAGFGWSWVLKCSGDSKEVEAYLKDSELEVMETAGTLSL